MTPKAQNIAIAKACGKHLFVVVTPTEADEEFKCGKCGTPQRIHDQHEVLDYTKSLDAMHEAEKILTPEQYAAYINMLDECSAELNLSEMASSQPEFLFWILHSPADRRAEAFLRTLNLWEE